MTIPTFNEYMNQTVLESRMNIVARRIADTGIDPYVFLYEAFKDDPDIQLLMEQGMLQNIGRGLSGMASAIPGMAKSAWQNMQNIGQQAGQAYQAGKNSPDVLHKAATDAVAKANQAMKALVQGVQDLRQSHPDFAMNNPNYGNVMKNVEASLQGFEKVATTLQNTDVPKISVSAPQTQAGGSTADMPGIAPATP